MVNKIILIVMIVCCWNTSIANPDQFLINNGDTIVFLGDSITEQGAKPEGYVELFKVFLNVNGIKASVINAGISGHKSNDMLARLDKDVLAHKPNWVSISCGVNDVWHNFGRERDGRRKHRGLSLDEYKKNMTAMIDRCLTTGAKVLLLTATPIFEDLQSEENQAQVAYNDFLRTLAKEKNCLLCDLSVAFQDIYKQKTSDENLLTTDGVHLNPRGNRLMTRTILKTLGAQPQQINRYENRVELIGNM